MNSWRPYPLLRLVFPFLAGIIAGISLDSHGEVKGWIIFLLAGFLISLPVFTKTFPQYRLRWITGILINVFLIFAGYHLICINRTSCQPGYLGLQPDGLFVAMVSEPPAVKNASHKVLLEVKYRRCNERWERVSGRAVGHLKCKPGGKPLQFGDHILLHAGFNQIRDNSNPHAFNYFRYLANKNINHQVFADQNAWTLINIRSGGMIRKIAFRMRDHLLNVLRENQVQGKEFAVASALLLGYVAELDAGLRHDYAASGAMHILSVSGMHVGIIYIFLEFLLGFLNKRKALRFLKALVLLIFIWFYAMLTGLSPCVFRSAAMLSLPILAKSMNRTPDMFNIISASIFIILALDPFLLLDVGFQLSYLAVSGIVILYKPIYDLYVTASWFPDKVWSILAVSIAAQIATLPITLYTFHQFPNYFMVTNIFVVPLSSLIIYVGILLLAIGAVPVLSFICAKVLIGLVWLLNYIIHIIEQLPYSTTQGIYISSTEMIILYLIVGFLFLFLTKRRISWLFLFLGTSIALNLSFMQFNLDRLKFSGFVVYNSYRTACYQFICQDRAVSFYRGNDQKQFSINKINSETTRAELDARGIKFHRAFWLGKKGIQKQVSENHGFVFKSDNFFEFSGKRMVILRSTIPKCLDKEIKVDYLILSGNPRIRVSDAVKTFHPQQIIIDGTNSRMRTFQWLQDARTQQVECHSVTQDGAFVKEF